MTSSQKPKVKKLTTDQLRSRQIYQQLKMHQSGKNIDSLLTLFIQHASLNTEKQEISKNEKCSMQVDDLRFSHQNLLSFFEVKPQKRKTIYFIFP